MIDAQMKLYYQTFSNSEQNPPLLILHGLFGSSHNWRHIAKQFADDYRVFSIDLRNHGRSEHSEQMSYPVMAGDIDTFIQEQQLSEAVVLGHSMGGKVAMQLALNNPARMSKLIVVDIAPNQYTPKHQAVFDAIHRLNQTKLESRKQADELIIDLIPEEDIRLFLLTNLSRMPDGQYRWHINMPAIQNNYQAISAAVDNKNGAVFNKPALFIRGEQSDYIQEKHIPPIRRLFPKAEIETIAEAGHWLHVQRPVDFLQVLRTFLLNQ